MSTSKVEKAKPNEIDTAMGIKNCAWSDVSNKSGVSPAIVVKEVRMTARSRWQAASTMASRVSSPRWRSSLKKLTRMIESFTTIPESPKRPNRDSIVRSISISQWPTIAPTSPKGMALMTTKGQPYELKTQARTK